MKTSFKIFALTCVFCLMAGFAFSQKRNRNILQEPYNGLTISVFSKVPFGNPPGLQGDVRLGNLRLGAGGSIFANATENQNLSSKTTFKENTFFVELGWNPFGIWQVNKEGSLPPCNSFQRVKKQRTPIALATFIGVGYQRSHLTNTWAFKIDETTYANTYTATVQYPYAHAGMEMYCWKFLYLAVGYKGGFEIPHSDFQEMIDILLDPTEQVYGFRFNGHAYVKVGISLFLYR